MAKNTERREIEKTDTNDSSYLTVDFENMTFYKMDFVTPPDRKNEQYHAHLFITGYKGVYLKVLFYFSVKSEYTEEEIDIFMKSLVRALQYSESL